MPCVPIRAMFLIQFSAVSAQMPSVVLCAAPFTTVSADIRAAAEPTETLRAQPTLPSSQIMLVRDPTMFLIAWPSDLRRQVQTAYARKQACMSQFCFNFFVHLLLLGIRKPATVGGFQLSIQIMYPNRRSFDTMLDSAPFKMIRFMRCISLLQTVRKITSLTLPSDRFPKKSRN